MTSPATTYYGGPYTGGGCRCLSMLVLAGLLPAFTEQSCADSEGQPIPCVPVELPAEARYERQSTVDDFETPPLSWRSLQSEQTAQATLHRDTRETKDGTASLRIDYRFSGQQHLEYLQLQTAETITLTEAGLGIGFWLKHDGTPFALRLRLVDSSGENHQLELQGSTAAGWQFVVGRLDSESSSWGGDEDGRKDYPCRLSGVVIDRPQRGFAGAGSLWIDSVAIVRPRDRQPAPLMVQTREPRFGNIYRLGETIALAASGPGERIRWRVTDFFGQEVHRGAGSGDGTRLEWTAERIGWFDCRLDLLVENRVVNTQSFLHAVLPKSDTLARSDFVGVCCHFGQNRYPLDCLQLMRDYGIDQYRDEIGWRSYEQQVGTYALPAYAAAFLERSRELTMRPLLILDYSNPHYDGGDYPNSPEAIRGFTQYAVDLARQTRGAVSMFEVWNEWIGGCGMKGKGGRHDAESYGRLLKPTYAALKDAFPELTVVGIGGEYGPDCTQNIVTAADVAGPNSMDAWSIHPYRYPRSPESSELAEEVRRIARTVREAGVTSQAWVTEIGYPTHRTSRGCTPADQARFCVRTLVLLQSTGIVEKVFWYDLKDDGTSRDYNEHNFGLIHHQQFNCAPKPGIVAMSAWVRMVGDADFRELKHHENTYAASYRRDDGSTVIVAWTLEGQATVSCGSEPTAVFDMMGTPQPITRQVQLSESPLYLIGAGTFDLTP